MVSWWSLKQSRGQIPWSPNIFQGDANKKRTAQKSNIFLWGPMKSSFLSIRNISTNGVGFQTSYVRLPKGHVSFVQVFDDSWIKWMCVFKFSIFFNDQIKSSRLSKPCSHVFPCCADLLGCVFPHRACLFRGTSMSKGWKNIKRRPELNTEITGCQAHGQPIFLVYLENSQLGGWGCWLPNSLILRFSAKLVEEKPYQSPNYESPEWTQQLLEDVPPIFVAKKVVSFHWTFESSLSHPMIFPHFFFCPTFLAQKSSKIWPEVWIQTRRASKEDQYPPRCFDESGRDRGTSDSCFYPLGVSDMPWQVWPLGGKSSTCTFQKYDFIQYCIQYCLYIYNIYIYTYYRIINSRSRLHRILLLLKVPLYRFKVSSMIRSAPADVYVLDTMCTYLQSLLCAVTPVSIPRCRPGTESVWTQGSTL